MTPILKKQLTIWLGVSLCGGALLWNVGASRAQDGFRYSANRKNVKLTREQATKGFVELMSKWTPPSNEDSASEAGEDDSSILTFPKRMSSISSKSMDNLGLGMGILYRVMLFQWAQPTPTIKAQYQADKTVPNVIEKTIRPERPLVLIQEKGGWGVDLVETFALWNNLQGTSKAEEIYKITGVILTDSTRPEPLNCELCQSNLKQIGLAMRQYIQDYDDKYPIAKPWNDALKPYLQDEPRFNCPSLPDKQRYGYSYNSKLSNKAEKGLDITKVVAVYETSVLKRNAYGVGENLAFRHQNGANYAFADGHVKWFPKTTTPSFKLKP